MAGEDDRVREALARFNAGDPDGAERICDDILAEEPDNADALHLSGVVRLIAGDVADAVELLARAVESRPDHVLALEDLGYARLATHDYPGAEAALRQALAHGSSRPSLHLRLGMALISGGRAQEAIAHLDQALAQAPEDAEIHLNRGIALISEGHHADAVQSFRKAAALEPENPGAHLNLGNALAAQGRAEEALTCYRQVLALDPGNAAAHFNFATLMSQAGNLVMAERALKAAIAAAPHHADAHNNLGVVHQRQQRLDDAAAAFRRALVLDPNHLNAQNNLGALVRAQGRLEEAVALHERALEIAPGAAQTYVHLGDVRTDQGLYALAQALYRKALELDPASADACNSLGNALAAEHRWGTAATYYARATELAPTFADAQYNLGLARLYCRDFAAAWPGYEQRLNCEPVRTGLREGVGTIPLYESLPRWRGPQDAEAGTVAVWAEQGIGDQVLFSTLLPELAAAGTSLIYEVDERLLKAYQRSFPAVRFVALDDPPHQALQEAGRVVLAGSLPAFFRQAEADFARQPRRLLNALPERVAHYRQRLEALGPGIKVALSWRSSRTVELGPRKSVALAELAPLLAVPGAHFVDVQYGDTRAERAESLRASGVDLVHFDEVDTYHDLEELLAILEACDLLITTSNATAHFAGALGKRTWLLYTGGRAPFHYWTDPGSGRSLWYPAVEFITGAQFNEWRALIEHAADCFARKPD